MGTKILAAVFWALILMSVPAYAFPPVAGTVETAVKIKGDDNNAEVEVNAGPVQMHVATTTAAAHQWKSERAKRIYEMLRKKLGEKRVQRLEKMGVSPEEIARRVSEKMSGKVTVNATIVRKWKITTKRYADIVNVMRRTGAEFAEKRREWERYRAMYVKGKIDENTYFNVSKDFVLSAIDTTIARLEVIKNNMEGRDLNTKSVEKAIAELKTIREDVENAEDLETLREIYRDEVLPKLRAYHNRMFARAYILMTVRASQSIVNRLDIAAARLTRIVNVAKEHNSYTPEMGARVEAVFAKIETVKAELNALEAEVRSEDIKDVREYMTKLREIKNDVVDIYMEIRDILRDYMGVRARAKIKAEVKTENRGVKTNTEVEVNA